MDYLLNKCLININFSKAKLKSFYKLIKNVELK